MWQLQLRDGGGSAFQLCATSQINQNLLAFKKEGVAYVQRRLRHANRPHRVVLHCKTLCVIVRHCKSLLAIAIYNPHPLLVQEGVANIVLNHAMLRLTLYKSLALSRALTPALARSLARSHVCNNHPTEYHTRKHT